MKAPGTKWRNLQEWFSDDKEYVKKIYKHAIESMFKYDLDNEEENEFNARKWIKKHFNIASNVSLEDTIKWVNKLGKQKVLITLDRLDYDFMYQCDGDIDEVEAAFDDELENYPENVYFINC
jgi:hypothetical protein